MRIVFILPQGSKDEVGKDLRRRREVEEAFRQIGYALDFDEIEPSLIQPEGALPRELFSVWDERLFFKLPILDYNSAGNLGESVGVLRPEGTLPVCRYLASRIADGDDPLPAKLMYSISCFRNEPVDQLIGTKYRSFNQLGVETFGPEGNDQETMVFASNVLTALGVENARFRINDIRVFDSVTRNLTNGQKQELQSLLDSYSGQRATNKTTALELPYLPPETVSFLGGEYMSADQAGEVNEGLGLLIQDVQQTGITAVFDPTVVRGFSYYTGSVFQIDVKKDGVWLAEIAGGGRYDNALGQYLSCFGIQKEVPAIGFAFGTERLIEVSR